MPNLGNIMRFFVNYSPVLLFSLLSNLLYPFFSLIWFTHHTLVDQLPQKPLISVQRHFIGRHFIVRQLNEDSSPGDI